MPSAFLPVLSVFAVWTFFGNPAKRILKLPFASALHSGEECKKHGGATGFRQAPESRGDE